MWKRVGAAGGMVLLAVLAWVALERGWGDLLALQARATLRSWERSGEAPDEQARQVALSRLERALQADPGNPAMTEDLGRLQEMMTLGGTAADPAVAATLRRSLDYLRESRSRRPTSPYTWANVALVKARLGEVDQEFLLAIDRAAVLGPWEPEVQWTLADVGFRYWARLPQATQATIRRALERGLKRQDARLFELATRHARLDVLCTIPGVARSKRASACL